MKLFHLGSGVKCSTWSILQGLNSDLLIDHESGCNAAANRQRGDCIAQNALMDVAWYKQLSS